jgi:hypothetical protein
VRRRRATPPSTVERKIRNLEAVTADAGTNAAAYQGLLG